MKTLRLLITFYKSYAFASIVITIATLHFTCVGGFAMFASLLWVKIITFGMIAYLVHNFKKEEFYYYKNLGMTRKYLWISTFSIDFIIFLTLTILTLIMR